MKGEKVRRHNTLNTELPPEIRREVDRLLVEGGVTYDDIKEFLAGKRFDISRSSIGRYGKDFLSKYQRLRIIEDQSRTLVSEVGDGMILEEAAAKLFAQKIVEAQISGELNVLELPRLVSDFAKLQASTVMRERFKREIKEKVVKAADDVSKTVKSAGLSEEKAEEIRKKILGIV